MARSPARNARGQGGGANADGRGSRRTAPLARSVALAAAALAIVSSLALGSVEPLPQQPGQEEDRLQPLMMLLPAAYASHYEACPVDMYPTASSNVSISYTSPNGTYILGNVIDIRVNVTGGFNNPEVLNHTRVKLDTGAAAEDRFAVYESHDTAGSVDYNYTVQEGDQSSGLDYASSSSLYWRNGTAGNVIKNQSGAEYNCRLPDPGNASSLAGQGAVMLDGVAPLVRNVSAAVPDGAYVAGQVIRINVNFSEAVRFPGSAMPQPALTLGLGMPSNRTAAYESGNGTATLVFNYTVRADDNAGRLDYNSTGALAGANITDIAGNAANLTLPELGAAGSLAGQSAIALDNTAPLVQSVSAAVPDGAYAAGQVIRINVNFSEAVRFPGSAMPQPTLTLAFDGPTNRTAAYESGNNTAALAFNYTVRADDDTARLDYSSAGALAGMNITDFAGNAANLTLPEPRAPGSLWDASRIAAMTAPSVANVSSPNATGTYAANDTITVRVAFTESVTVLAPNSSSVPYALLDVGIVEHAAPYSSGNGTAALDFSYTVRAGAWTDSLNHASISLNGSSIADAAGNAADLALPDPAGSASLAAASPGIGLEAPPVVVRVSSPNATATYGQGDTIGIDVDFTGPVAVGAAPDAGVPLLALETGATDRDAAYASGNGTGTLSFAYTVMQGDEAADLDYAGASALRPNGGMLNGTGAAAGQAALLALPDPAGPNSLAGMSDIAVDGVSPSVARVSSPGGNATYAVGDAVAVRVTFTENVTVAGAPPPALALNVSGAAAAALYASGNGTDTLSFAYTVREGDEAADLDYAGTGALSGGAAIADAAGNAANTTLPAQPGAPGSLGALYDIVLDGAAPAVARVTSPNASGTYGAGDLVSVVVEMTRNVTVAGAAAPPLYLYLDVGGGADAGAVPAPYVAGSGTASLAFSYTVADGDGTARLAYPNSTALVLNGTGAAVTGLNGAAANLTLPPPGADGSLSGPSPPAPAIAIATGDPPPPPIAGVSLVNASLTGPNTVTVYYNASISAAASSYANLTLSPGGDRNVTGLAAGNNTSVHTLAFDGPKARSDAAGTMSIAPLLNASARFAGDPAVDVLDGQPYPFVHDVTTRNATGSAHTGNATVLINVMFSEEVFVRRIAATDRSEGSQVAKFATGLDITTMFIELNTGRNATLPEQIVNSSRSYDFIYKVRIGDDSDGILGYINSSSLRTDSDLVVINNTLDGADGRPLLNEGGFPVPGQESASLALPVPGSPDSLSGSGRLYVYEAPLIASLSAPRGTYGVGDTIPIAVNLTRSLSVSGGNATLELGSPSKSAEYASGNGTTAYAFSYRVQQGDSASRLFAQPTIAVPAGAAAYLSTSAGGLFRITADDDDAAAPATTTVVGGGDAAADPSARPILEISGVNVVGAADRRPTTPTVAQPAPVVVASGGFGGGGGGGGGGRGGGSGGVGLAIGAGGVTLYSASWDCAEGVIRVVINEDAYIPDVTVLSSSGSEVAAKSEAQDLPGRTVYEAALSDDTILSIRAVSVDGRAVSTASEVVRTGGACTGDVTFAAYTGPGAAPRQQPQQPSVPDDGARGMMPPDDDSAGDDARPQPPRPGDERPAPPGTDGDERPAPPPAMSDRPAFEIEADRDASYYVKRYAEQPEYRQWFDDAYPQYADICEAVGVGSGCVEEYVQQRDDALGAADDSKPDECAEGMVMRDGECADATPPPPPTPPTPTTTAADDDDSGCLIATAAFGTELAPQVQLLREVRDGTVLSTSAGSAFMASFSSAYYAFSPHVADLEREFPAVRHAAALLLTPMLYALQVVELAEPGSERDVLAYGIAAIALVAGMYVAAPAAGAWYACRHWGQRRRIDAAASGPARGA